MTKDCVFSWLAISAAAGTSATMFLTELVAAKALLPAFGGAPGIWVVCLACFQAALVTGCMLADAAAIWTPPRIQMAMVFGLIGVVSSVPTVALSGSGAEQWAATSLGTPNAWQVVAALTKLVGGPFLCIACLAPLLAHWRTLWRASKDSDQDAAYRLSIAANAGSAAALIAYPMFIEPTIGLANQRMLVLRLFQLSALLALACGLYGSLRSPMLARLDPKPKRPPRRETLWRIANWMLLAALPASWLAGVTAHVTVEVAPIPLLWIVPLAAYLGSFMLVFSPGSRRFRHWGPGMLAAAVATAAILIGGGFERPAWLVLGLHVGAFSLACMALHGRLVDDRPPVEQLTTFYLCMAAGGACGGLFNAVVAPLIFDARHEYPLVVAAAAAWIGVVPAAVRRGPLPILLAAALFVAFFLGERHDGVVHRVRSFFGVLRVCAHTNGPSLSLRHGAILHGAQLVSADPARRSTALSYYHEAGPLGSVFHGLSMCGPVRRVGVAGLGVGTVAAYGRPGQAFTFFEIDPDVVRIASDPRWFSFLADSAASVRLVVDDARRAICREPDGVFDLLVIDAFTGDAVPTHLLTREALAIYGAKTTATGCIALHISNRHLNFEPIVAALAADGGWMSLLARDDRVPADYARIGSRWMVLSRSLEVVRSIHGNPTSDLYRWVPVVGNGSRPWTDDRSALAEAMMAGRW